MKKWQEVDAVAIEDEMGDLLYGLIRMLKPEIIVETGCYFGHATFWLVSACEANEYGHVITCDTDADKIHAVSTLIRSDHLTVKHTSSLDLPELPKADFVFSDSNYATREKEIALAKEGAVIVVHDTSLESHKYDLTAPYLGDIVKSYGGLIFNAGRGFGIIVKQ